MKEKEIEAAAYWKSEAVGLRLAVESLREENERLRQENNHLAGELKDAMALLALAEESRDRAQAAVADLEAEFWTT